MTHTADAFAPVTRLEPCAICGKADWCRRSASGGHECHRDEHFKGRRVNGLACVAVTKDGFGVYRAPDDHQAPSQNGTHKEPARPRQYPTRQDAIDAAVRSAKGALEDVYDWSPEWSRVRIRTTEGKQFREITRCGPVWVMKGPKQPHVLYGQIPESGIVTVHEGEKAVDAARSIGLAAVTSGGSSSAGKADWSPLKGRDVVIFPDADEPGEKYARQVAELLGAIDCAVRLCRLPGLPAKGDIADFVNERESQESDEILSAVMAAIEATKPETSGPSQVNLLTTRLSDVAATRADWLCYRRIARRSVTILAGSVGRGKSLISVDIVATVTTGKPWPLGIDQYVPRPQNVIMVLAEDDLSMTVRPRIEAAGGDVSRIHVIQASIDDRGSQHVFSVKHDAEKLAAMIEQVGDVGLVVLDPLSLYLGRADQHSHGDTYANLAPLAKLAQDSGVAILAVHHFNKGRDTESAVDRVMGSAAFSAIARNVWAVVNDDDDPTGDTRLLAHAKASLGPLQPAMRFNVEDVPESHSARINWREIVNKTADELQRESRESAEGGRTSATAAAVEWLKDNLTTLPISSAELLAKAASDGISKNALVRAKAKLGAKSQPIRDANGKVKDWNVWLPLSPEGQIA